MTTQGLDDWIGRKESCDDNLDIGHIQKIALSLGASAPKEGEPLPLLWQWGLFIGGLPYSELGTDGHPKRGGFLPPADNRNRMWAGGRVNFLQSLRAGHKAHKESTILAVKEKVGSTGKLLFVTVQHDYSQDGSLCISEEQDIVYREPSPPKLQGSIPTPAAQWSDTIEPSSIMLFRYSAVTFNGHRIHYDYPYTTETEGYPGLVVHGPMIATLMCRAFTRAHPDKAVISLSYRGLRPLISPTPFNAQGMLTEAGVAQLWAEQDGTLAHQAELRFKV
ncbi:FAS1-like dehydratase domain-containing protein [Pollutimonas harenae]|uniref:MaoC family dehydratase N-terminal domain-containing protein n=1 Tax=Pollutimonas harenae TaxID=657015 RepID=A0A853GVG1_9BURK|nr:MaoC family dehydratase N-terminal domain-containing protein [Pollutimonas harenae]NYT86301.1 MaoC family dehydratase N-terminal domain-containing protein [Pollutimonas harenae]TEA69940.1 itaconyl-CoA hydratase [Pollutimonas harenae]